jgi:hypothetical protein
MSCSCMSSRSDASTACAVAVATARLCGCTVEKSPVRSITPSRQPLSGSWIGAAEHVQRWTTSLKCSGPKTWTAWSAAIAVPMALVPAPGSLQSVPSVKFMWSAARMRRCALPSTLSRTPLASVTTTRWSVSSATAARHSWMIPAARESGCSAQSICVSSSSATIGAIWWPVGSMPAARERRHDSKIGSRTSSGSPS